MKHIGKASKMELRDQTKQNKQLEGNRDEQEETFKILSSLS